MKNKHKDSVDLLAALGIASIPTLIALAIDYSTDLPSPVFWALFAASCFAAGVLCTFVLMTPRRDENAPQPALE